MCGLTLRALAAIVYRVCNAYVFGESCLLHARLGCVLSQVVFVYALLCEYCVSYTHLSRCYQHGLLWHRTHTHRSQGAALHDFQYHTHHSRDAVNTTGSSIPTALFSLWSRCVWIRNAHTPRRYQQRPPQVEFCDTLKALLTGLLAYVQANHKTGLAWNPRGGDASSYTGSSAASSGGAHAPPAVASRAGRSALAV